jgi:hypothetical protein
MVLPAQWADAAQPTVGVDAPARVPQQVGTGRADQGEHEFVGTRRDPHAQAFVQFRADQAGSYAYKLRNSRPPPVRYRGLARNQLGLSLRVAAINLRRLIAMGLDHHDAGWVLA